MAAADGRSYFSNNIQKITLIFTLDEVTSLGLFKNFSFHATWKIFIRNTVLLFGFPERYCPSSVLQRQVPLVVWLSRLTTDLTLISTNFIPCVAKASPLDEVSAPSVPGY